MKWLTEKSNSNVQTVFQYSISVFAWLKIFYLHFSKTSKYWEKSSTAAEPHWRKDYKKNDPGWKPTYNKGWRATERVNVGKSKWIFTL